MIIKARHIPIVAAMSLVVLTSIHGRVYGIEAGGVIVDQVWDKDDSPVRVISDLSVAGLTIMPGVLVEFAGDFRVTVNGIMRVVGTGESPVVLKPARNIEGWKGIHFENTMPGSEFEWCQFIAAQDTAVRLVRSNASFLHCTFVDNRSPGHGGAIYADLLDEDLVITDCDFQGNNAGISGGAIGVTLESGTLFVENCTFTDNVANPDYLPANSYGGAVWVSGNSSFRRSTFRSNQVHAYTAFAAFGIYTTGGALSSGEGNCEIKACKFLENSCQMTAHSTTPDTSFAYGGAVELYSGSMMLQNCLLAGNTLSAQRNHEYRGSALYTYAGGCVIENCTFANNTGDSVVHSDTGRNSMMNSISYLNNDCITQISGPVTVSYSDIQGGFAGAGVINLNPVFDSEYRILPGSPAIDAGHPDPEHNDTHFPPSLGGDRNDMGYLGGPNAFLWLDNPEDPNEEILELEQGTFVRWPDRTGIHLEWAVGVDGPWQPYNGEELIVGTNKVVLIEEAAPRKYFRLVKD